MYDPVIYHLRRAYPGATLMSRPRIAPAARVRCASAQHHLTDAAFDLTYAYHDAKDVFIATLEIHARQYLRFPVECPYFDLHGCYVVEGSAGLFEMQPPGGRTSSLSLRTATYALIYAPKGNYMVEIPPGITVVYLWCINDRILLRTQVHPALAPLYTLLGQWKGRGTRCHHTRILPFAGPCKAEWDRLLALPRLRPLTMDHRLLGQVAALIYCCVDTLTESRKDQHRSLKLVQAVRAEVVFQVKQGNVPLVGDLAAAHAITESYLVRIHRKYYGTTVKAFITKVRMQRAIELMGDNRLNMTQVAYLAGYTSLADFRKQYQAYFNKKPKRF